MSTILSLCAKQATLEKFWMKMTKIVVIKRGQALNPRIPVVYLGFEYRSVHEAERRGFTVKPTEKNVDECLDIFQLRNAKAVMTPLTELKRANLHDETMVCDQAQHTLFQSCGWGNAVQNWSETRSDVRDKMLVIQTRFAYTCGSDTCQESAEILERNTRPQTLLDDTGIETL